MATLALAVGLSGTAFAAGPRDFAGTFVFDGTAAQQAAVKAEIERAAAEFNPIIRLVARSRLENAAKVPQRLLFKVNDGELGLQKDSLPIRFTRPDGSPVQFTHDGKTTTLTRKLAGNTLTEVGRTDDAERTMTFTLDGDKLTVTSVITSKNLKQPLRYTVTYTRK